MKYRFLSALIVLCMLFAAIPTVSAAEFTDIEGHWAKDYIDRAVEEGLFYGITEDEFWPNATMTRAMFVTVLGRFEGIREEYWGSDEHPQFFKQDTDNNAYYAPYVRWAVCNQIVSGLNEFLFAPDAPITREQMAAMLCRYVNECGYFLSPSDDAVIPEAFSDADAISEWAFDSVESLRIHGLLTGYPNEDGSYSFLPQGTATRAEVATVFCTLMDTLRYGPPTGIFLEDIVLETTDVILSRGESAQLRGTALTSDVDLPFGGDATIPYKLFWLSTNSSVVSVDQRGLINYVGEGCATIYVYARGGDYATCQVICEPDAVLPQADWTKAEKCEFLFGENVSDPRLYYNSKAEAEADMVNVTVRTWDLKKNGEKYTREWELKVHKNLADTVVAIFEEIYNGEEQFPIHELYCFSWSGKSEHSIGTAIDINWSENYYCDPSGNALVGNYWKPGEDPYSIPKGGDVANAFEKYGFRWGINWNSGYKDYMHFSFFGT